MKIRHWITILAFVPVGVFAQLASTSFDYKYEMDVAPSTQDLDSNSVDDFFPGTGTIAGAEQNNVSYSGGIGTFRDDTSGSNSSVLRTDYGGIPGGSVWRHNFVGDPTWTAEARIRVLDDASFPEGGDGSLVISAGDGGVSPIVKLFKDRINFSSGNSYIAYMTGTDFTADFYVIRIARDADGEGWLWVNNQLVAKDQAPYSGLGGGHANGFFIGGQSFSSSIRGAWEIDYLRLDTDFHKAPVPVLDSSGFSYRYDMDVNPSTQDLDSNGTVDFFWATASGLTIPQVYTGGSAFSNQGVGTPQVLFRTDYGGSITRSTLSSDTKYTIETRVKKVGGTQGSQGWFSLALQSPGTSDSIRFAFHDNQVLVRSGAGGSYQQFLVGSDFTSDFHTVRIARVGLNEYLVWVDGLLLNSDLDTPFNGTNGNFNSSGGWFIGDFSGDTLGDWELDYIHYDNRGIYAPDTAPDMDVSTVAASPAAVPADGGAASTITVTVKNAAGTGLKGRIVALAITSGPGLAVISPATPVTTDSDGIATFQVNSNYVGTEVFTATDVTDTPLTIAQTASVDFLIVSQTSLVGGSPAPPPPNPDAPQTSLAVGSVAPPTPAAMGVTAADSTTAQEEVESTGHTPTQDVVRVTEYYLTTGEFSGTTAMLTLDQELASDYFILVRGSREGDGRSMPDNDHARVVSVPGGRGALADSGAVDRIGLQRRAAEADWEGVVTVVECLAPTNSSGFRLVDALVTTLSGTSGTEACAPWDDVSRVVPFGGYRGGGVELVGTPGTRYEGTGAYVRLYPTGNGTLAWERDGGGEILLDALMTTFVVEWGDDWTVQHANVAGSSGNNGADETDEYTTAAINPVARVKTWVWGTGTRADAGIGDCAESCLVTLGDGVKAQATESTVAVGSEYPDAYSFDVYSMTHPGLAVDHRFKPDGDRDALDLPLTVNAAPAGARLSLAYNGCSGTSSRFPRPRFWSRYTADDTITISRGYDGADFPAWIQAIDFSGLNQ